MLYFGNDDNTNIFSKAYRFGSVRFGKRFFRVRRGSACVFLTRRGLVRFGSVRFCVRLRPVPELIKRFGSVRFGQFGLVSCSFLNCVASMSRRAWGLVMNRNPQPQLQKFSKLEILIEAI